MPRSAVPLTETQIRALTPRDKRYFLADGNGLVLEVMSTGSKFWRFRYTLNGVRQPLATIGDYRKISLRVARERARKYAEMVAGGTSPVATARRDRGAEKRADVVREGAELYLANGMTGKSDDYRQATRRALEKDVLPAIGGKRIGEVTAADIAAIGEHIKNRGAPKMALHTRNTIRRLYDFLIARQLATENPAHVIPARFSVRSSAHSAVTPPSVDDVLAPGEIGARLRTIYASNIRRPLKLALHLLVLTMARKSELLEATWAEFDLDRAQWTLPAARTKTGVERGITLPRQALAMLRELRGTDTRPSFVFPTVRGNARPIARSTLNQAVKALGLEVEQFVLHDFRHTASAHWQTWGKPTASTGHASFADDKDGENAHANAASTEQQRHLFQWWADFVDEQMEDGGNGPKGQSGKNGRR
jgi:integrase